MRISFINYIKKNNKNNFRIDVLPNIGITKVTKGCFKNIYVYITWIFFGIKLDFEKVDYDE